MDWFVIGNALLTLLFVVLTGALILIILIQRPQGGGLSGAFGAGGGASTQSAFGAKTGDVLTIVTCGIFVLLLITGSLLVGLQKHAWGQTGSRIAPPSAPSNLIASYQSDGKVELKWKDNSENESGFRVERALAPVGEAVAQDELDWLEIAGVDFNEVRYLDEGPFEAGRSYWYQILAYNPGGDSDPTGSQSISVPGTADAGAEGVPEPAPANEDEAPDTNQPPTEETGPETDPGTPAEDASGAGGG